MSFGLSQEDIANLDLSKDEYDNYVVQRRQLFKGTIVVAIAYGVMAIIILSLAVFTEYGKELLGQKMFIFTLVFVIGMIVVILTLAGMVLSFRPQKGPGNGIKFLCPDYWEIESANDLNGVDVNERILMSYACKPPASKVNDPMVKDSKKLEIANTPYTKDTYTFANTSVNGYETQDLKFLATKITNSKLKCDRVFPDLLRYYGQQHYKKVPNKLACEFSKQCGVSWSSVCGKPVGS